MTTEKLDTVELKNGQTLEVYHSPELRYNRAYSTFLRQVAELVDSGHGQRVTFWDDVTCGIIWGEIDGSIAGIFAYNKNNLNLGLLNISLTSVLQEHRGKGIHTVLNSHFEQVAQKLGAEFVVATVHPRNQVRITTVKKDGYTESFVKWYKRVTKDE